MQTRQKRRLSEIANGGLDEESSAATNTTAAGAAAVNEPAVDLYQALLATVSKLQLLQNGRFCDGGFEESTSFLLRQETSAGRAKLKLAGTRTRWQDLSGATAKAQQQLLSTIDCRRQDLEALEAQSASLCLRMETSTGNEQKELSDELYCLRQMIGKHKTELQKMRARDTLEIEAGVEREECLVELSVLRSWSGSRDRTRVPARSGYLYVFGGGSVAGTGWYGLCLDYTFRYDASQNKWTRRDRLGRPRRHHAGVSVGKYVYTIGGVDSGRGLKNFERLDVSRPSATWEELPSLAQATGGALALAVDKTIFLLGGSGDTQNLAGVAAFDTMAGVWSESPPMSESRQFAGGVVLEGKLYVFGGRGNRGEALARAERCSPKGPWSELAPLKVARWGCGAAVLNNQVYAIGGLNGVDRALASVERYDPALDVWVTVAPLCFGRGGLVAAVLDNSLYALGGTKGEGETLSSVERYDEHRNAWTVVTSLPVRISGAACAVALS